MKYWIGILILLSACKPTVHYPQRVNVRCFYDSKINDTILSNEVYVGHARTQLFLNGDLVASYTSECEIKVIPSIIEPEKK